MRFFLSDRSINRKKAIKQNINVINALNPDFYS